MEAQGNGKLHRKSHVTDHNVAAADRLWRVHVADNQHRKVQHRAVSSR